MPALQLAGVSRQGEQIFGGEVLFPDLNEIYSGVDGAFDIVDERYWTNLAVCNVVKPGHFTFG